MNSPSGRTSSSVQPSCNRQLVTTLSFWLERVDKCLVGAYIKELGGRGSRHTLDLASLDLQTKPFEFRGVV